VVSMRNDWAAVFPLRIARRPPALPLAAAPLGLAGESQTTAGNPGEVPGFEKSQRAASPAPLPIRLGPEQFAADAMQALPT